MLEVGGARAWQEKGLTQVTFNWISTDQSDSTTQIRSVIISTGKKQQTHAIQLYYYKLTAYKLFSD